MADERDNKSEPATPRRRQEARESGQVTRSADLTAGALLIVGLYVISLTGPAFLQALRTTMMWLLGGDGAEGWQDGAVLFQNDLRIFGPLMFRALAPLMLAVAGAAILIVGLQVGFHISFNPLMPSLGKLSPFKGLGRLFAGRNLMQLTMNLAKLVIIVATAWSYVQGQFPMILSLSGMDFPQNFAAAAQIIFSLAWRLAWALFILAGVDWIYQKWRFERDIRMTKQEIKEESKRQEGDLEVKGRRRQLARKMIMQRIYSAVPRADVVITNPTELAVALQYDPDAMGAPRVVAKGAGFLASRIRQVAIQSGVPIVERKPLAQALYKTVDVGQEVPPQFYQAIAEILAYVYELAGKGVRRMRGVESVGV